MVSVSGVLGAGVGVGVGAGVVTGAGAPAGKTFVECRVVLRGIQRGECRLIVGAQGGCPLIVGIHNGIGIVGVAQPQSMPQFVQRDAVDVEVRAADVPGIGVVKVPCRRRSVRDWEARGKRYAPGCRPGSKGIRRRGRPWRKGYSRFSGQPR